ncbi:MAG TPA: glutamate mutase L [Solirubrobacterales bacterium]|nr:glutamate mutase L [Solirubrobacterales bacterium]
MGVVALADFGSTYTKLRLVDPSEGRLLARAEAPTTIGSDLMEGYAAALEEARRAAGSVEIDEQLAVSSAGGGLKVAAVGLVEDLTAAAARQAALNSGARVEAVLAGTLDDDQLAKLEAARPEIVLFAGGTDGGQAELVLENARRLGARAIGGNAVVACNAAVAAEAAELLRRGGSRVEVAANVMPSLGQLEIEPAREAILRVFLDHVIGGKGLSASAEFQRMVRLPTPEAVLEATRLLGDVVVVDVGGATTDVHSNRTHEVEMPGVEDPLLPPPLTLRTVEGDLGMRFGAAGAMAVDGRWIEAEAGMGEGSIRHAVSLRGADPKWLPEDDEGLRLDGLLAIGCATHALARHCGTMLLTPGRNGPPTLVRSGPDLREAGMVLGTGGVFSHRGDGERVLREALARKEPRSLVPVSPDFAVDSNYVLAAVGLLATEDREAAISLLRHELNLDMLSGSS